MEAEIHGTVRKRACVTLVDYGMGNLWSVASALRFLGAEIQISKNPDQIQQAEVLILPGVGSFLRAMERLRTTGIAEALYSAVTKRRSKILGICLGMQLLAERGFEEGESPGLGLIPGQVERFTSTELNGLKLPHIGFNYVTGSKKSQLMKNLSPGADFYFVHSYKLLPFTDPGKKGMCHYGVDFVASYERENIFGVQFHPEKSQTNGLRLIQNFLAVKQCA